MIKGFKKAYYIACKDLKAYYLKPPLISWGLMLPLVFILAFYLRNPQRIADVSPGLVGMTMLFSTTSKAAIVISFEKRIDALDRLLMAPVSLRTILFGKALGAAGFGFAMSLVSLLLVVLVFGLSISQPFSLFLSLILSCFAFAFLGILISVSVREVFEAMTLSNFFRFPMIFLCGVFFPITSMPIVLKVIAFFLPLTYSVDALRQSMLAQDGLLHRWLDVAILLGFSIFLFEFGVRVFFKRSQEQ